ncbi:MAG: SDR family NAD(P)-dependent oxidoreductase [Thermomicrobiales bacterium]
MPTALVTGASKGIGRATALALAEAGIDVAVNARDADGVEATAQAVRERGRQSLALPGDMAVPADVHALTRSLIQAWKGVDVLVNNVGVTHSGSLSETTDEAWERLIHVNLRSMFLLTRDLSPYMIERRFGRIINISSMTARLGRGFVGSASYGASKGGVVSFTRGLAKEFGPYAITVNAVAPGVILTDMNRDYMAEHGESVLQGIPLGRFGEPNDVTGIIVFLASDAASYITGTMIDVNGGLVFG